MRRPGPWIALWLFGLAGWVIFTARNQLPTRTLERLWQVPSFEVTGVTTKGESRLRLSDLLGKPWVADFIFTRCGGPCPLMSGKMAALQRVLSPDIRLVSFSVDPDYDKTDVLKNYAARFHADPSRWVFARANKESLYKLVYEGFRLSVAERRSDPAETRVLHSTQFVLVDAKGFVRGFYDSTGESFFENLSRDVKRIAAEPL